VTIKLRTGVKDGRNTVHKLMPRVVSEWGVGCMTVSKFVIQPFSTSLRRGEGSQAPLVSPQNLAFT